MESSDNTVASSPALAAASQRRSGRVVRAPEKFATDAPTAAKRKRNPERDDEDVENESPDAEEDDEDEDAEEEADDGDAGPASRKRSSRAGKGKKPAAKRPKVNGNGPALANHAAQLPSRPKKSVRVVIAQGDADGLFAEIFASGDSSDDVASRWFHRHQEDGTGAVTDLVNCILQAAGCDQQITEDDIRDPDNAPNRLADLQTAYADEGITDYPLISRAKSSRSFRDLLVGFFKSLVGVLHETDVLYKDAVLMENIARWVASMSSSTLRPFRHTATTVALGIELALVDVAKKLDDRITKMTQQTEAEKGRRGRNTQKLSAIQQSLEEANQNREVCQELLKDFFDTVFVHRYRDIDPKIRSECVEALGSWIWALPTVWMVPEYLRYLGWMLSDSVPHVRQEVLKQLGRIFRRDAANLGHFIDRFRSRLVEIATKDTDVSVRVAALSVIDILRISGMLEPDEIDSIGKLIYDSELRVRKAVIDFFAACVDDAIEAKVDDMGGGDVLEELFGDDQEEDYNSPRKEWISIKCLAELLAAYDEQLEAEEGTLASKPLDIAVEMADAGIPETRISLASQVLYEKIDYIRNWEVLSGYLLFDHTASTKSRGRSKTNSSEEALRAAVAPASREETILLEVLASAVKLSLMPNTDLDKTKRRPRVDAGDGQEEAAMQLAVTIPRLLKKYGAEPSTATVVLRLEHYLNLEIFQQLRQDSTTYERLLDEICTQFNRHMDRSVLSEATAALLHARRYEELEEVTDVKVSVLWENAINSLRNFDRVSELSIRGNLDAPAVIELGNVLVKMSKLASISSCVDVLEAEGKSDESSAPVIEILARTVHRGKIETVDEELDDLEDEAVSSAIKCCQFYFMWKVHSIIKLIETGSDIDAESIAHLNRLRKTYDVNLIHTLSSRGSNDDLRLFATGGLCDLHILFASLRQSVESTARGQSKYGILRPLAEEIMPGLIPELMEVFDAAERAYAKRSKKTLNGPAEDEDPVDDDDELSDDENEDALPADERKTRELKAEKALCELAAKMVMATLAKMVDQTGPHAGKLRRRILRNQSKLGNNFKEVVSYLDEKKMEERLAGDGAGGSKKKNAKGKGKEAAGAAGKKPASEEIVVADDEDEAPEDPFGSDDEPEEGTVEDLRRRELLDDPVEDDEDEDGDGAANDRMDEDEDVLGD